MGTHLGVLSESYPMILSGLFFLSARGMNKLYKIKVLDTLMLDYLSVVPL